jgi:hypothetical protein
MVHATLNLLDPQNTHGWGTALKLTWQEQNDQLTDLFLSLPRTETRNGLSTLPLLAGRRKSDRILFFLPY